MTDYEDPRYANVKGHYERGFAAGVEAAAKVVEDEELWSTTRLAPSAHARLAKHIRALSPPREDAHAETPEEAKARRRRVRERINPTPRVLDGEDGCIQPYMSHGHDSCPPTCSIRQRRDDGEREGK